jgi:acetolactate decarboxylase
MKLMKRYFHILLATAAFSLASCQLPEKPAKPDAETPFSIQVNDTDFSKGRLGYRQELVFEDLVKLHGHPCDGLIEGALALEFGLYQLYPDMIIDRTNTRVVSHPSPCLTDAALLICGARYQYGTYFVSDAIPGLYVIGRTDRDEAFAIRRKEGVKPPLIDVWGNQAIAGTLSPCGLDSLRLMEEEYAHFLLDTKDLATLFEVEELDNFDWNIPLRNDFLKTDILNKNAPACISNQ